MSVTQISAKELHEKLQVTVKPLLLDVRELNEFEFARIEGSLHIPLNQIPARIKELDSTDGFRIAEFLKKRFSFIRDNSFRADNFAGHFLGI